MTFKFDAGAIGSESPTSTDGGKDKEQGSRMTGVDDDSFAWNADRSEVLLDDEVSVEQQQQQQQRPMQQPIQQHQVAAARIEAESKENQPKNSVASPAVHVKARPRAESMTVIEELQQRWNARGGASGISFTPSPRKL